jgi:hypothetical protein
MDVWQDFAAIREQYRHSVEELRRAMPALAQVQQELVDARAEASYPVETPVVYNEALDEINPSDEIKLILLADNPGRREQAKRRYLVGPSGKIADTFFQKHAELGLDFRKNVLILNKTPIHTARTAELKELCTRGGAELAEALLASQADMARLLWDFHRAFAPLPVWIIGYSEMKRGGIFERFTETIRTLYAGASEERRAELYLFRHFSMNQFTSDLQRQTLPNEPVTAALKRIGAAYRLRILGW